MRWLDDKNSRVSNKTGEEEEEKGGKKEYFLPLNHFIILPLFHNASDSFADPNSKWCKSKTKFVKFHVLFLN